MAFGTILYGVNVLEKIDSTNIQLSDLMKNQYVFTICKSTWCNWLIYAEKYFFENIYDCRSK